jgi:adenylate cyclase class 2
MDDAPPAPASVPELLWLRRAAGDGEFLVTDTERLTFAEADLRSRKLASALLAAGTGKGTRVGILFPNNAQWLTAETGSLACRDQRAALRGGVPAGRLAGQTAGGRVREVEVKYRVDDLEGLAAALKGRGIEPGDPVYQDDQAYAPAGWEFGDSKLGVSFVRLRTVDSRHYFALKQPTGNAQDCLEYETEVADRAAMHGAIVQMGYRPTVRVAKTRRVAVTADCSVCVDDVEGVGGFVELERMLPDDGAADVVQAELAALVESLGIAATRTSETYDSLVRAAQEESG